MTRKNNKQNNKYIKKEIKQIVSRKFQQLPRRVQMRRLPAPKKDAGILSNVGGWLGNAIGGDTGANIGRSAGSWFSKLVGLGAYKVKRNAFMSDAQGPAAFAGLGEGVVISHREFISDVSGSIGFSLSAYPVNAAYAYSFPWLSAVASNFEQYDFEGLVYEYRPTCATAVASTNTALGTVVMATNYDSLDSNFTTKQQMEAYEFANSSTPFMPFYHPVECAPRLNTLSKLYCRDGAVPSGGDKRFYDLGTFQIATIGMQAASVVGELWVTYKVRLLKPKLPDGINSDLDYFKIQEDPVQSAAVASSKYFGTTGGDVTGTIPSIATSNSYTIPYIGSYLIVHHAKVGITVACTATLGGNIALATVWTDDTATNVEVVASQQAISIYVVNVSQNGMGAANTVTIGGGTGLAAGNFDVFVVQLPSLALAKELIDNSETHELLSRVAKLENMINSVCDRTIVIEEDEKEPYRMVTTRSRR